MFNIGDKLIVTDRTHTYDFYEEWAKVHNLSNWNRGLPGNDSEVEVVCRGYHSFNGDVVYGVEDVNGQSFIMNEKGLKKAPKKVRLDLEIVAKTGVQVHEHGAKIGYTGWPISTIEVNLETGEVTQIKEKE